jgi:hypothetical protein
MTPEQFRQYHLLVDALWGGEIGEVEFTETALDLGASLERINQVLNEVRAEDGVF